MFSLVKVSAYGRFGPAKPVTSSRLMALPEAETQVRYGAGNLKAVKNRMKSVQSTGKIMKTMKMIASSRLRAAQDRMEKARPFGDASTRTLTELSASAQEVIGDEKPSNHTLVVITADKGLCGAINSNSVKSATALLNEDAERGVDNSIVCVGIKGVSGLQRKNAKAIKMSVIDSMKKPMTFLGASIIADEIVALNPSQISLIYNKFVSVVATDIVTTQFQSFDTFAALMEKGIKELDNYEFEEDNRIPHLQDLYEFHLACGIFQACLETNAAELGARMSSMDSASKNASELVQKLSIQYNRGRQAAITTELTEIISGAQAVE